MCNHSSRLVQQLPMWLKLFMLLGYPLCYNHAIWLPILLDTLIIFHYAQIMLSKSEQGLIVPSLCTLSLHYFPYPILQI